MALLTPALDGSDSQLVIERLDLVLWNLTGMLKTQRLIFDIGITFLNPANTKVIGLLLPFSVSDSHQCEDLSKAEPKAIDLLSPNLTVGAEVITLDGQEYMRCQIQRFQVVSSKGGGALNRRPISHLRLHVGSGIEFGYIRARFHVVGPASVVIWKRSGLGLNGAIIDIEPVAGDDHEPLPDSFSDVTFPPVKRSSVTVILRSSLQRQASFPELEGALLPKLDIWESYLNRRTDFRRQGNLVAYRDVVDDSSASIVASRRVFLDVSREFGLLPVGNLIRSALVIVLVAGIMVAAAPTETSWNFDVLVPGFSTVQAILGTVGALGTGGVLTLLSRLARVRTAVRWVRVGFHRFERYALGSLVRRPSGT